MTPASTWCTSTVTPASNLPFHTDLSQRETFRHRSVHRHGQQQRCPICKPVLICSTAHFYNMAHHICLGLGQAIPICLQQMCVLQPSRILLQPPPPAQVLCRHLLHGLQRRRAKLARKERAAAAAQRGESRQQRLRKYFQPVEAHHACQQPARNRTCQCPTAATLTVGRTCAMGCEAADTVHAAVSFCAAPGTPARSMFDPRPGSRHDKFAHVCLQPVQHSN